MKPILLSLAIALLMFGCGEDAVDASKLQIRNGLNYLPNEETPFTGRAEEFYENGQKWTETNYKDGKADGLAIWWYENGQKWREGNYKDGKRVGLATGWYESGQKKQETNFKDGKKDGLEVRYKEDGTELNRWIYKDGERVED